MMAALDAGADDFNAQDDCFEVFTSPADFSAVREALEAAGYTFLSAEQDMIPSNTVDVNDPEMIAKSNVCSTCSTITMTFRKCSITQFSPRKRTKTEPD